MNALHTQFGWMFTAIAAIFALGLAPRFARHFYPASPNFLVRLAAPVSLATLGTACFMGMAIQALVAVVAVGVTLILISRGNGREQRPDA